MTYTQFSTLHHPNTKLESFKLSPGGRLCAARRRNRFWEFPSFSLYAKRLFASPTPSPHTTRPHSYTYPENENAHLWIQIISNQTLEIDSQLTLLQPYHSSMITPTPSLQSFITQSNYSIYTSKHQTQYTPTNSRSRNDSCTKTPQNSTEQCRAPGGSSSSPSGS